MMNPRRDSNFPSELAEGQKSRGIMQAALHGLKSKLPECSNEIIFDFNGNRIKFSQTQKAQEVQVSSSVTKWYLTESDKSGKNRIKVKEEDNKRRFTRRFFTWMIGSSIVIDGLVICLMLLGVSYNYLIPIVATSSQLKLWGGAVFSKVF